MQYTILGRTGLRVSRLGFGCMRLPMKGDTEIDREKAVPMLLKAFECGVNLYDTAVGYCGGDSQRVLGEVMQDKRDKIVLSTKNPHYDKKDKDTWWKNLNDSLERLRTDHIDIYNHHGLNYTSFEQSVAGEDGLYKEMLKAKEQGLIRHICCSFHGPAQDLVKLADTGMLDTVILQYNLLSRELEDAFAHANAKGMGILVMGPVGGGRLGYPSEKVAGIIGKVKSTPELALRFVLSNPNIHVALSGMSTMQQVEENCTTVSRAGKLTEAEHRRISEAIEERKKLAGLYCTGCNYCMPCPAGVDIPANFEILNLERVFGLTGHARERYAGLPGKAALCRLCGKCLSKCPQKIDIPKRLGDTVATLDERAGKVVSWCELRGGALQRGTLSLKLRCMVKNFGDAPRKVRVQLVPHGEDGVRPEVLNIGKMDAYARKQRDVELSMPRPGDAYCLDAVVSCDGAELIEHLSDLVVAAKRVRRHSPDVSKRPVGTIHVPSPFFRPATPLPSGYSFDFAVRYDDENLYVWADVEDDLAGTLPAGEEPRRGHNGLRIVLDGRTPYMIGQGGHHDGTMYLMILPRTDGKEPVAVKCSNDAKVSTVWERTAGGYRVECAVPWSAFAKVPVPPAVIGFAIAMRAADAEGKEKAWLSWTCRPHNDRSPAALGKLVTV